jgi:hypothetical protein
MTLLRFTLPPFVGEHPLTAPLVDGPRFTGSTPLLQAEPARRDERPPIHTNYPGSVPADVYAVLVAGGPAPAGLSTEERRAYEQLDDTLRASPCSSRASRRRSTVRVASRRGTHTFASSFTCVDRNEFPDERHLTNAHDRWDAFPTNVERPSRRDVAFDAQVALVPATRTTSRSLVTSRLATRFEARLSLDGRAHRADDLRGCSELGRRGPGSRSESASESPRRRRAK